MHVLISMETQCSGNDLSQCERFRELDSYIHLLFVVIDVFSSKLECI